MKILHVYKTYYKSNGGIEKGIKDIVNNLNEHSFSILCCEKDKSLKNEEIKEENLNIHLSMNFGSIFSMPIAPFFIFDLWKLSKKHDIIHAHYPMPLIDIAIAMYKPKKTKLIYHYHCNIVFDNLLKKIFKSVVSIFSVIALYKSDKIIVSDERNAKNTFLLSFFQQKIEIIPFFVDIDETEVKNENYILSTGRFVSYKGFDILIQAMKNVNFQLIIAGAIVKEKYYNYLEKIIFDNKLEDRIKLIPNISYKELNNLYKNCKFFVFPSTTDAEAFGIVQIEVMKYGKAIINTNLNTGVANVARNNIEAITVESKNILQLETAINSLLKDEKKLNFLSKNAKIRIKKEFSKEKNLIKFDLLYKNLIK